VYNKIRKRDAKINFDVLCDRFYLLIILVDITQRNDDHTE